MPDSNQVPMLEKLKFYVRERFESVTEKMEPKVKKSKEKWKRCLNWLKKNKSLIGLGIFLNVLGLLGFYLEVNCEDPQSVMVDFLISLWPELIGIGIGILIIDFFNERRQEQQFKQQLILQMGSSHNDVCDTAVRTLRARGWLTDGTLNGAHLIMANLDGLDLTGAVLVGAHLNGAKLRKTILEDTNLQRAHLDSAKLNQANLLNADLRDSILPEAEFKEANIAETKFSGAYLFKTNLADAKNWSPEQFLGVVRVEGAVMPDGFRFEEMVNFTEVGSRPVIKDWPALLEPKAAPTIDETLKKILGGEEE